MLYKVAPYYRSWFKHTLVNDGYDYGKGAQYVQVSRSLFTYRRTRDPKRALLPELV